MKKLFFLAGIITALFSSCDRDIIPRALFSANYNPAQPGETVQFTNQSTGAISYRWDFGDGSFSSATHPSHRYSQEGTYTVNLNVESRDGYRDEISMEIIVAYFNPEAAFAVNYSVVQPGEVVIFTNQTLYASTYQWDFGDGYVSNEIHPTHHYDNEGTYKVVLTATGSAGLVDRVQMDIKVKYTELEIVVAEWNQDEVVQYIVPGSLVILYETLEDWETDVNRVVEGFTDDNGIITIIGLGEMPYYVYAELNDFPNPGDIYDNWDMPNDYIRTGTLVPFTLNYFTCWVDYYPNKTRVKRKAHIAVKPAPGSPSRVFVPQKTED